MITTDQAIEKLATAFCKLERHDKAIYIKCMQSIVRMAISEKLSEPARNIQKDLDRITQIQEDSRKY